MKLPPTNVLRCLTLALLFLTCYSTQTSAVAKPLLGQQIVLEADTGTMAKEAAAELAQWLEKIAGKPFEVITAPATPTTSAIFLLKATSPQVTAADRERLKDQGLEAFLIRGDGNVLQIIANDMRGQAHGVYFYLEQLGVRWLLPGANWTIVPRRDSINMSIDRLCTPAFWARSWAGTGGFYSVLLGRQYTGSAERAKGISDFEVDATAWQRRLRLGGQSLGKSTGEAFVADRTITPVLEAHPEYLAKIDGKYSPLYIPSKTGTFVFDDATQHYVRANPAGSGTHELNIIVKLNAGNPDAVNLYANWILRNFRAVRSSARGYAVQTVSVEPSDGGGEGNNYDELKAQGVGDGSESDQEFYIANQCARLVRAEFPDTSVIMLAYATRSDPPTFPLEPNFIVQPALGLRMGRKTAGLSNDEWLALWTKTARNMALYTYWSIPDWTHDEPTFNYLEVAKQLRDWHAKNINGLNAETTYSAGAMGLGHYVAAHIMWDPTLDESALIADWYDKAFGPARTPMRRMLERWATGYRPISTELGISYRDMDEARRLAVGNAVITARLDDYARYLHYLRLRNEFLAAAGEAKKHKASELAEYIFDIHESRMVHTTRAFDLLAFRGYPELKTEFYRHGGHGLADDPPDGPGWARVHTLTHDEVAALIDDGLKAYPAPDFALKSFKGKLVPLAPAQFKKPTGDPWGPTVRVVADLTADIEVLPAMAIFPLRVSRLVDNKISIADDTGRTIYNHLTTTTADKGWDELSIPLPPGHYTLHFSPKGGRASGYFSFGTWQDVPLILRSFLSPKGAGTPRLYFYVPRGLEKIALYFPLSNRAGGFETPVYLPDGTRAIVENRDGGKVMVIPVPAGQDGKVWALDRFIQPDLPMETLNIPQSFSLDPQGVWVPHDALE